MKNLSRRSFVRQSSLALFSTALIDIDKISPIANHFNSFEEDKLLFFDAYSIVGPRQYKHPAELWKVTDLIQQMDYCSISGAMVAYTLSLKYDAHFSNLELISLLKNYPNLYPIWNVLPDDTDEFPDTKLLGKLLEENQVYAVTINPLSNGWDWSLGLNSKLLDWLNEKKLLTITTAQELGGWEKVKQFLERFPEIPLLITGGGWVEQRYIIPLVKSFSNLHISFDHLQVFQGLEYFYKEGLIDQLVFATNAPIMSAGAHRTYVSCADIPLEAKQKIASGNLLRLLKKVKPPKRHSYKSDDVLMKALKEGKPLPRPIVDMHMHVIHEGLNGAGWLGYRMLNGGPKGLFAMEKKIGCVGGGFMSWVGTVSGDSKAGNELVRRVLDDSPPGYWGLATFDTTHYSQQELSEMIPRVYADKRFIGMKPYWVYGVEYDDPSYDIWWEYGNRNRLYGLLHTERNDLREIDNLASRYPNVRWLIAHSMRTWAKADMAIEVMKKHSNVFAEITFTAVPAGIIEYMVSHVGGDRIVYGTDIPMRDPRAQLGWVVFADVPVAVKEKILSLNAFEVVRPCIARLPDYNVPELFKKLKSK